MKHLRSSAQTFSTSLQGHSSTRCFTHGGYRGAIIEEVTTKISGFPNFPCSTELTSQSPLPAASILYERLQRLQTANIGSADPGCSTVTDGYLVLLNALSCVGEDQAWILSSRRIEPEGNETGMPKRAKLANCKSPHLLTPSFFLHNQADGGGNKTAVVSSRQERQVITLGDIRKDYQIEVERIGNLLSGGFFI